MGGERQTFRLRGFAAPLRMRSCGVGGWELWRWGEEVGIGGAGEGARKRFGEAEGEEAGADGALGGESGVDEDGKRRGEGVAEAVIAVDAGDLFDEIDLTLEVETPGGEGYLEAEGRVRGEGAVG